MRSRTIRPIVAGLASVAVLAGCSGGGPDWQAGGIDLDGLEESLEAIDAAWRSQLTAGEVRVNLPESARCYFQVVQDREVTDEVLCGPYRLMASEATAWQRGELTFYPGESAETVTPALALDEDGRPEFDQGEANPNSTPTRPDGEAADLTEQVEEPEAPLARPGQQIDGVAAEAASTSVRVITPAADDLFQVGVTTERLGGAEDRLAPPDGGSFVLVDTSGYPSTEDTAYVISAGGTDYPFTPASGPTALAIPGDGRDARLGVTYDALTQWFSVATGERQGSAAAGYYDGLTEEASAACPEEKPEERVAGFNREFSCRVRVARTAYLAEPSEPGARKTVGWAADGLVYVSMDLEQRYSVRWYADAESYRSAEYDSSMTVDDLILTVDGKTHKAVETIRVAAGFISGERTTAIFEVPAGQATMTLSGEMTASDTLEYAGVAGAPGTGSASYDLALELEFPRASS